MKRKRWVGLASSCMLMALTGSMTPASACVVFKPFRADFITNARSVFRGTVVDYKYDGRKPAVLTFSVKETLYGAQRESWTLFWRNATFPVPATWTRPVDRIVAVAPAGAIGLGDRVLQDSCTTAFLFEDNDKNREMIEEGLACFEDDANQNQACRRRDDPPYIQR